MRGVVYTNDINLLLGVYGYVVLKEWTDIQRVVESTDEDEWKYV